MATLTATTKTAVATAINALLNGGAFTAPVLIIGSAGATISSGVLCTIQLSSGAITSTFIFWFSGFHAAASNSGTAAVAIFASASALGVPDTEIFRCTVGVSTGDLRINTTSIVSGKDVQTTQNFFYGP